MLPPASTDVARLFEGAARRYPLRPCLSWHGGGSVAYGELAAALEEQCGLLAAAGFAGRRIGLMTRNRPELVLLWLACTRLGATPVFLNPQYTEPEARRVVEDLELALLVADSDPGAVGTEVLALDRPPAAAAVAVGPAGADSSRFADAATVVLTSGSTGRPKYVPVPNRAYELKATLNAIALGWGPSDTGYCVMPLFHVGAQSETLVPALVSGARVHLCEGFSASGLWDDLEDTGATHLHATGSLLAMALARAEPRGGGALRRIVGSLRVDLAAELGAALPAVDLLSVYGLTECPLGTLSALGEEYRPGWVGYPYLGGSLRIEEGEIQLRNPACTPGYIGLAPGEGYTEDGWLRTGDLGVEREGGLYLTGRIKEMIRRSGENIAPAEIEEAALRHPGVAEAAALPFPDRIRDEEVWLLVEPREAAAIDPDELRAFMAGYLARFKLPRYLDVVPELPMTASNKVDKPRLRQLREQPAWDAETTGPES